MKYAWLEKLAQDGNLTEESKAGIYASCKDLLKKANTNKELLAEAIKGLMTTAGGVAVTQGMMGMIDSYDQVKGRDQINKVKAKLMEDPDFEQYRDKVDARCNEVAQLAPHVAMNENLMKRFISTRLQSGLTDQDAQKLTQIQATYTPNYRKQQGYIPKKASISPQAAGEILGDVYCIVKTAAPKINPEVLKNFLMHTAVFGTVPILTGLAAGGVNMAMNKLDNKKLKSALDDSFQRALLLSNPDEGLRDKPEKSREAFQALAHFAPHVAVQPQAARAFMAKLVSFDQGLQTTDLRDLTEIEKNLVLSKKINPFLSGLGAGAHAAGAEKLVGHATEVALDPFSRLYKQEMGREVGVKERDKPAAATG